MENDVLMFSCSSEDGESTIVTFTIARDYNIYTFHRLCKRAAAAFGYADKSIEEAFGETVYEE